MKSTSNLLRPQFDLISVYFPNARKMYVFSFSENGHLVRGLQTKVWLSSTSEKMEIRLSENFDYALIHEFLKVQRLWDSNQLESVSCQNEVQVYHLYFFSFGHFGIGKTKEGRYSSRNLKPRGKM